MLEIVFVSSSKVLLNIDVTGRLSFFFLASSIEISPTSTYLEVLKLLNLWKRAFLTSTLTLFVYIFF